MKDDIYFYCFSFCEMHEGAQFVWCYHNKKMNYDVLCNLLVENYPKAKEQIKKALTKRSNKALKLFGKYVGVEKGLPPPVKIYKKIGYEVVDSWDDDYPMPDLFNTLLKICNFKFVESTSDVFIDGYYCTTNVEKFFEEKFGIK